MKTIRRFGLALTLWTFMTLACSLGPRRDADSVFHPSASSDGDRPAD